MELKNFFAQDDQGNTLGEATCYLYVRGTENLVSGIFKANGAALSNPFTANQQGLIQFVAPNGLYDMRVVKGARDFRLQVQCNDVEDTRTAVEGAAERAEAASDAAVLVSGIKANLAEGLAATTPGQHFMLLSPGTSESVDIYENVAGVAQYRKSQPSAAALQVVKNKLPDVAPLGYQMSIMDENGKAAVGVKDSGALAAQVIEAGSVTADTLAVGAGTLSPAVYPGFVEVTCDAAGHVAVGIKDDGTFAAKAIDVSDLKVTKINGESYSPGAVGRSGGVYSHQINFINNAGQSLGEGATPATALTTVQEYDNVGFAAHADAPTSFVQLTVANTQVSSRGESPMYGTLGHIKELIAEENGIPYAKNDYQLVACNNAYSGFSILTLNKGTTPYSLAMSQVQAAFNIAMAAGKTMAFQAVTWTQGEANTGMDKDVYKGHLKQLAIDYNVYGKVITGQYNDVRLICYQTASANRNVAIAQLEAANESPLIYMACPMYQFDYGDTQHITAESSKWLGGYYGLAYKRIVVDRQDWQPLQPMAHAVNGNTLDLIFNKTGLVLDTTLVPAQVNHGFEVRDAASAAVSIIAVEVIGPNRVRLKLASTPAPGWFVRYGYNIAVGKGAFVGGCGNLRDCQGETLVYSAVNKPLHNWCVIFNYSL